MIFNIQRFSTHDGNGIRTLIFYKGCPLRCLWCSNPESQSFDYDIIYDKNNCKNFGDCINANPAITKNKDGILINHKQLKNTETLKDICVSKALTVVGENLTVNKLVEEIEKDTLFYNGDGGVTLSGGEPLSQGDEIVLLLHELKKRRISVNIETTLHVNWEKVERIIELTDTFLVDLKHIDQNKFKTYTKGNADLVMNNLKRLTESGAHVIVRIPVIPDFNHTEKEISAMIDFAASLRNIKEIHFLPYHTFGVEKYIMLGMNYLYGNKKQVQDSELTGYINYTQTKGFQTKIGG